MRLHLSRPFCLPAELDGYRSGEAAESANSELEREEGSKVEALDVADASGFFLPLFPWLM